LEAEYIYPSLNSFSWDLELFSINHVFVGRNVGMAVFFVGYPIRTVFHAKTSFASVQVTFKLFWEDLSAKAL
jgi:hypothetical protein